VGIDVDGHRRRLLIARPENIAEIKLATPSPGS